MAMEARVETTGRAERAEALVAAQENWDWPGPHSTGGEAARHRASAPGGTAPSA
jgi:hypothetical protein